MATVTSVTAELARRALAALETGNRRMASMQPRGLTTHEAERLEVLEAATAAIARGESGQAARRLLEHLAAPEWLQ